MIVLSWQPTCVFICVVLVIASVIHNAVTGITEWEITSTNSSVSFSDNRNTLDSQRTTDISDTRSNPSAETSFSDEVQSVYTTDPSVVDSVYDDVSSLQIFQSDQILYLWDKTNLSPRDYQQSYCPYRCQNGQRRVLKERNGYCLDVSCLPCLCRKPECQIYGICCPDISVLYWSPPNEPIFGATETDHVSQFGDFDSALDENGLNIPTNTTSLNDSNREANAESAKTLSAEVGSQAPEVSKFVKQIYAKPHLKVGCGTTESVIYIRSCLPGVQASGEVFRKCESDISQDEIDFDSFTPVTDNRTQLVYYNKYCAECNGVKQLQAWDVEVVCQNFMRVYTARSMDEFLRQAFHTKSGCSVKQKHPVNMDPAHCDPHWFTLPVVDTCNVTGLWREYDDDVVDACASLNALTYRVSLDSGLIYKNIFCAICNKQDYPTMTSCGESNEADRPVPPYSFGSPYSILFNLRDKPPSTDSNSEESACNTTEWASPDGSCMPVHCSPGKNLIDGNCSTAVTQITGLGYQLRLWLFPEVDNTTETMFKIDMPPSRYAIDRLYSKLVDTLFPSTEYTELSFGTLLNTSTPRDFNDTGNEIPRTTPAANIPVNMNDMNNTVATEMLFISTTTQIVQNDHFRVPYLYWITGVIISLDGIHRDKFEQTILDDFFGGDFLVNFDDRLSVNFKPVLMWHDFDVAKYCSDIEEHNNDIKCFHSDIHIEQSAQYFQFSDVFDLFLNLTKTLTCKYVSFPSWQYSIETTYADFLPVVTVKLNFTAKQLTLTADSDLSKISVDASGELNICCDLLDKQIALMPVVGKVASLIQEVQYVLTLVCMGVSMMCLLLTVITYAKFAVLRSVAGRNNLCLCVSLLLAQASLLASFYIDVNSVLCVPVGMLTHYLWLSLFSWNFLCCFYMYKVFGAKIHNSQTSSRSQNVTLIKNIILSLLTPALVVLAVVVGVYVTSGGSSLGYGGHVCYLNQSILVATAMIGPVVLTTVSNIIFFVATIYNIHRVSRLQRFDTSKKDDRHNLYIYVKLSSMTGAFWVTFIIAEVSDLNGLRILAIILNGCQGLFIFMSYICNKRVLMLYLPSLRPHTTITSRTSSVTTTLEKRPSRGRQENDKHELQHTQSVSSIVSEQASASVCSTDNTLKPELQL